MKNPLRRSFRDALPACVANAALQDELFKGVMYRYG